MRTAALGAYAALLDAGARRDVAETESAALRDPRVRAVFLIAPAFVQALAPSSLRRVNVPAELVLREADQIASAGRALSAQIRPGLEPAR
jgi:predicted dienelactone hydrolase